jgi:hypothetical protein
MQLKEDVIAAPAIVHLWSGRRMSYDDAGVSAATAPVTRRPSRAIHRKQSRSILGDLSATEAVRSAEARP